MKPYKATFCPTCGKEALKQLRKNKLAEELEEKIEELSRLNAQLAAIRCDLKESEENVEGCLIELSDKREERWNLIKEIKAMLKDVAKQVDADKKHLIDIGAKLIVG